MWLLVITNTLLLSRKSLGKGRSTIRCLDSNNLSTLIQIGYKVGRVDQAETALGAEMRLVADKFKGKTSTDKGKDKIVRRYVVV